MSPLNVNPLKVLCVFSTLLGNGAATKRLSETLERIPGIEARFERITVDDYRQYPAPWWTRLSNPWHGQYIAKAKAGAQLHAPTDLLIVNTWEYAVLFQEFARRVPSAVMLDSVPATVNEQLRRRGHNGVRRNLSHFVHHRSFKRAVGKFKYFLPTGSDCADALANSYGVSRDRCFVVLAPQDTGLWRPAIHAPACHSPFRLLFVGNDFYRKGGAFLLEMFSTALAGHCTLTIASNDPSLVKQSFPPGVTWLRGKSPKDLLAIYQESDLFVFPTRQDYMPQVLGEALATGLPAIATNVGGIRDLVRKGETGILMPYNATVRDWAKRILELIDSNERLMQLRAGARAFSERMLSEERFQDGLQAALHRLVMER